MIKTILYILLSFIKPFIYVLLWYLINEFNIISINYKFLFDLFNN